MPPPPVSIQKRGLLFFSHFFAFDISAPFYSGGERAYKKKGKGRRRGTVEKKKSRGRLSIQEKKGGHSNSAMTFCPLFLQPFSRPKRPIGKDSKLRKCAIGHSLPSCIQRVWGREEDGPTSLVLFLSFLLIFFPFLSLSLPSLPFLFLDSQGRQRERRREKGKNAPSAPTLLLLRNEDRSSGGFILVSAKKNRISSQFREYLPAVI